MRTRAAKLGGTAFPLAFWLFAAGCPGELGGLGPDLPEAGASDTGEGDAPTHDVSAYDAAALDAAPRDSAAPDGDASTDDATSGDASTGPDGASTTDAAGDASLTEAGCGAANTIANCGACGQACDTASGAPSCDGRTCSYVCNPGSADCNAAAAPDTDGCECATPGCCGASCQTAHTNGVGQTYYDCNPVGAYGPVAAMAACTAFASGASSMCSDNWYCSSAEKQVCYVTGPGNCQSYCWTYSGAAAGTVSDCTCPAHAVATWK